MHKKESFFQCFLFFFTEQLLIFPISFAILTLLDINTSAVYGVFLLMACASMLIRIHFSRLKRPILVVVFTSAILIFSYLWAGLSLKAVVPAAFGIFIQLRALAIAEQPLSSAGIYTFTAIGFFGYIIAAIFYNKEKLLPYMNLLAVCATLSALSACICLNMLLVSYEKAAGARTGNIPRLSRKSNRLMLSIFMLLILVFTAIGFADRIYAFLGLVLTGIIAFLTSIFTSDTPGGPSGPPSSLPIVGEEMAVSPFWNIIEQIFSVLAIITILAGIVFLLCRLAGYLKKHYREMLKKFLDRTTFLIRTFLFGKNSETSENLGYEDEITSLMNSKDNLLTATRRWLKARSKGARPYMMLQDNAQRARWLYAHIVQKNIKKGVLIKKSMTPKQVLGNIADTSYTTDSGSKDDAHLRRAVSCYYEARYGSRIPDDSELEALKALGKNH